MNTILFLQSEAGDPYKMYEAMQAKHAVYWDEAAGAWGVYSYKHCKAVLENSLAQVPALNQDNRDGLNEYALRIERGLVRLRNGPSHEVARQITLLLMDSMKEVVVKQVVDDCIGNHQEIDWVNSVCKRLPLTIISKSFTFSESDTAFIIASISHLTRIMLPKKEPGATAMLNSIAKELYQIVEKRILSSSFFERIKSAVSAKHTIGADEVLYLCTSNLIGLLIQLYDASRGLLSTSLLQLLRHVPSGQMHVSGTDDLAKHIIETLRFDPPVHHTRRVATEDILLGNVCIKKGELVLIFLAAANRDPDQFANPNRYDINRYNNAECLSFGAGTHRCPANSFSTSLTAAALSYVIKKYKKVSLLNDSIQYEPLFNVRLPVNIFISLK